MAVLTAGEVTLRGYGPESWRENMEAGPAGPAGAASSPDALPPEEDPEEALFARALEVFTDDRDATKRLQDELRPAREEWYQLYKGRYLDPALGARNDFEDQQRREDDGRSKIVSTDTMDAIEWIQPSLARIFFATDPVSAVGIGPEDEEPAERTANLMNYMFMRRGNGFVKAMAAMKGGLVYSAAFLKTGWKTEYKRARFVEPELAPEAFEQLRSDPDVRIRSYDEEVVPYSDEELQPMLAPLVQQLPPEMPPEEREAMLRQAVEQLPERIVYRNVVGTQRVEDFSGFTVDVVPPEDFLYDPNAETVEDAHFVIHRVFRTVDYLKRMERDGVYRNVDTVVTNLRSRVTADASDAEKMARYAEDDRTAPWTHQDNQDKQLGRRTVEVFEWWGQFDPEDSGILEPYVIVVAEDVVLRCEPNPYDHGQPPFVALVPIPDLHKFEGLSLADMLGEIQKIKTSVIRQILDNFSYQNNQMWLVERNARVEMASLLNPRPGGVVRADNINGIRQITPQPLHPWAFQFVEFMQTMAEQRTGVTRYNQGLDAQSLNKMLALDTPIPLIDGSYKHNADIVEGDLVVGSDGKGTRVLKAHPVQMPQRAFEVTFKSGDVVRAGGEHRWAVKVCDRRHRNLSPGWEKLPTERLFDLMRSGHKVFVPRVGPVDFTEKDLPIPPYLLGAWLGDGNSHTNRFTTMEPEIVKAFTEWAEQFYGGGVEECSQQRSGKAKMYQLVNTPFRRMLKDLGVLKDSRYDDTRNNVKHIPEIYLRGSFAQRLALLRGLMDTDGCVDKNGNTVFCNSEPLLVETFARLIESLGGKPTVGWRNNVGNNFKNARPHAHVTFSLAYCPVSLPRKVRRWKLNPAHWERQAIVSIREIPIEPMRCLTVEAADELYCCGRRLTLTSNTATGITAILGASQARIELIARMFAEGWQKVFTQCLALLRQFMPHDYVVRLYGEPIRVSRDDVSGNMDILISCGVAAGKSERIQGQLIQLLQLLAPLLQNGVMTPDNLYELMKRLLELWGFKDHSKLLSDPNFIRTLQEQLMALQQQLQAQAMQGQQMQALLSHPLVQQAAQQAMQDRQMQAAIGAAQPQTHPSQQPSSQSQGGGGQPAGLVPVGGAALPQMQIPPGQGGGMSM